MPIGGVDTGCIDVETSGLLGYRTIFNSHVPRGGPINQPFLGMTLDSNTWVLTTGKAKSYHEPRVAFSQTGEPVPICEPAPLSATELAPARGVEDVVYWGHYPMLELEFVSDAPVAVSATIWNPFIPGDLTSSTLPGAVFAVELTNKSDSQQEGRLIFSFPGPTADEVGGQRGATSFVVGYQAFPSARASANWPSASPEIRSTFNVAPGSGRTGRLGAGGRRASTDW